MKIENTRNWVNKNVPRAVKLADLLKKKSFFLFGPRGIGKSYLIHQELLSPRSETVVLIDLLNSRVFTRLSVSSSHLEGIVKGNLGDQEVMAEKVWVVIGEIQRLPMLLNEVHRLIELYGWRFLLTCSSSRKLKRSGTNLLAGQVRSIQLQPLCFDEIKAEDFDIERRLLYGALPFVYFAEQPEQELLAYRKLYIKEEIKEAALCRSIPKFTRFMTGAALRSGQVINLRKMARDYAIDRDTPEAYYSILEETFMGFRLAAWGGSKKRRAILRSKFYLSDLGVFHSLMETKELSKDTDLFERSVKHWIVQELRAYIEYKQISLKLGYWKADHRQEVDLTIGEEIAIRITSTEQTKNKHLRGLKMLREEDVFRQFYLVSLDPIARFLKGVQCLHCVEFLKRLWGGQII